MNNLSKSICAALALTFAAGSAIPLNAAPVFAPNGQGDRGIVNVQDSSGSLRRDRRFQRREDRREDNFERRQDRRDDNFERRQDRREGRFERRGEYSYYNGRRGYRERRPGYRQYNGLWFPAGAFIAGAIISGAINNQPAVRDGGGSAHVSWCYDRYRSYRASDDTYLSSAGVRRTCNSPYS